MKDLYLTGWRCTASQRRQSWWTKHLVQNKAVSCVCHVYWNLFHLKKNKEKNEEKNSKRRSRLVCKKIRFWVNSINLQVPCSSIHWNMCDDLCRSLLIMQIRSEVLMQRKMITIYTSFVYFNCHLWGYRTIWYSETLVWRPEKVCKIILDVTSFGYIAVCIWFGLVLVL